MLKCDKIGTESVWKRLSFFHVTDSDNRVFLFSVMGDNVEKVVI